MSDAIARIASRATAATPPVKDARTAKLEKAAGEFESLFVKQLLKEAKIGGDPKSGGGGYADMAVDALASGIQRGGGLGLAKRIEQALAAHAGAHAASPTTNATPAGAAVSAPAPAASAASAAVAAPTHLLQPLTRASRR